MYKFVHELVQCIPFASQGAFCFNLVAQLYACHKVQRSLVLAVEPQLHRYLSPKDS
jgi:hypothetical protein